MGNRFCAAIFLSGSTLETGDIKCNMQKKNFLASNEGNGGNLAHKFRYQAFIQFPHDAPRETNNADLINWPGTLVFVFIPYSWDCLVFESSPWGKAATNGGRVYKQSASILDKRLHSADYAGAPLYEIPLARDWRASRSIY